MKMNNIRVLGNQIDSPPEKFAKSLLKKAAEQRTAEAFFSVAKNRVKQCLFLFLQQLVRTSGRMLGYYARRRKPPKMARR
jgi:hypothetical protein